jgi:hypothetical protein
MKRVGLVLASFGLACVAHTQAPRLYSTAELEQHISYADVVRDGVRIGGIPRYSLVNFIHKEHLDFSKRFGVFTGFSLRNTGLIYNLNEHRRVKERVLTAGMPLGIKMGGMQRGLYVALGGEVELALNYKHKLLVDGNRVAKFNDWFSQRTQLLNPSLFAGVRFRGGETALYLRYYPLNWYNEDFTVRQGEAITYPNAGKTGRLFTLTWSVNLDCNCGCPQSRGAACCTPTRTTEAPATPPDQGSVDHHQQR